MGSRGTTITTSSSSGFPMFTAASLARKRPGSCRYGQPKPSPLANHSNRHRASWPRTTRPSNQRNGKGANFRRLQGSQLQAETVQSEITPDALHRAQDLRYLLRLPVPLTHRQDIDPGPVLETRDVRSDVAVVVIQ